ncbi:hypothetical protein ACFWP5_44205 [Streptomyces sp. NPDC058469]|uniref:hypothetical protein n=1 Tax=Streptomyces sp. NPDC058469 TaxID=3346514 RepID=UPI0036495B9E
MILTGAEIARQRAVGTVVIEPFSPDRLNPVSYNYRLHRALKTHPSAAADTHADYGLDEGVIPLEGLVLRPGREARGYRVPRGKLKQ